MKYYENRGNGEENFAGMQTQGMQTQGLRTLIMNADESLQKRDEAMYCLLNEKLTQRLRRKYEPYRNRLEDSFEDVLLDFMLYLRGDDGVPYRKLLRIRSDASFEGWMVTSFRNFAGKRAALARRLPKASASLDCTELQDAGPIPLDRLIGMLSTLVAYLCQELRPVNRLVFLRMLLTMLDKNRALPDKAVATSLGITDVYYRVMKHRLKSKVQAVKMTLLKGEGVVLTPESSLLASKLSDDFSNWYQTIGMCYEATLTSLPQSTEIAALRAASRTPVDARLLHDNAAVSYGMSDPMALWDALGTEKSCNLREPLA